CGAEMRKPDARVAGRALDDDTAGLQRPAALGIDHDVQGCAILDGSARVQELGLAEDLAAGFTAQRVEPDQRRVADGAGKAIQDAHGIADDGALPAIVRPTMGESRFMRTSARPRAHAPNAR